MVKRMFVVAGMIAATLAAVSSPAAGVAGFGDIENDRFYTRAVQWMVDNGITTGTGPGCFSPDDPVSRGQAAAFMWRMEGQPSAPAHGFGDVVTGWQQAPVSWMASAGITTGTSPTTFAPNDTLTRGQLATMLWRLAGEPAAPAHSFTDVVAGWQQGPVSWMASATPVITTGTSPTTFSPDDTVTRGQLATFFWRYSGEPAVTVDQSSPLCGAAVTFGPGTHLVGSEIPAGTYRADPISGCYWERLSGLSGEFGDIISNEFMSGNWRSAVVTIEAGDVAFSTDPECGTWTNDLSAVTSSTTAPFGVGQYIVGVDIAPGTWRATGGESCYWERVSGFTGRFTEIIANDFTDTAPIVAISAGDAGFRATDNCGTWTRIG